MTPTLTVVTDNKPEPLREILSQRIRRLQDEAKGLAREHILTLEAALTQVQRISAEIAEGGEAYPVGVRELCRRLIEDCEARVQTLESIASRAAPRT